MCSIFSFHTVVLGTVSSLCRCRDSPVLGAQAPLFTPGRGAGLSILQQGVSHAHTQLACTARKLLHPPTRDMVQANVAPAQVSRGGWGCLWHHFAGPGAQGCYLGRHVSPVGITGEGWRLMEGTAPSLIWSHKGDSVHSGCIQTFIPQPPWLMLLPSFWSENLQGDSMALSEP